MAGKEITDLTIANDFESGDLISIRKSGQIEDKALAFENLLKSIGNTAVFGFTALSTEQNKVTLTPSTAIGIDKYYNGMVISFISPIVSDGSVQIKIDTLTYRELLQVGTTETSVLNSDKLVQAIYVGDAATGKFYQTNLDTPTLYSNEYLATGIVALDKSTTTLALTSAIGVKKTSYYIGMSLLFTAPLDSAGLVRVNVDELGLKDLNDGANDRIANDLYKGQTLLAVYDGTQFVKNKFTTINEPPPINSDIIIVPDVPIVIPGNTDPYDPTYEGDPDDVINAISPDSVDSQGKKFFEKTITVGNSGNYSSISAAVTALIQEFGGNGGGKKYAILILNSYDQIKFMQTDMSGSDMDLRWISIFSQNNAIVNFIPHPGGTASLLMYSRCTPILNFKMKRTGRDNSHINCFFLYTKETTLTFGKNATIYFETPDVGLGSALIWNWGGGGSKITINATNGLTINSLYPMFKDVQSYEILFNKISFIYNGNASFIINSPKINCSAEIYNSTFQFTYKNNNTNFGAFDFSSVQSNGYIYMKNVTCTDRTGNMIGIKTKNCKATLENCNFNATNGYDIMLDGDTETNNITLKNTTGSTNQIKGIKTNKGTIYEVI